MRVGLVHAGVEQHEAVAGAHGPGVAVRHARPRQRQAQAKDARQHALAPSELALAQIASDTRRRLDYGPPGEAEEAIDGRRRQHQRGEQQRCRRWPPTCSRPTARRKRISGSKVESGRAPLLPGDRRTRPRRGGRRCGRRAGASTCAARWTSPRPRACARSSASCSARCPTCSVEVISTTTEDERCGVQWRMTGTFAGPGRLAGVEPTGRPGRARRLRPADDRGRADPEQRRVHRLDDLRPPDRHDAAAGLARRAAHDGRLQRQDTPDRRPGRRRAGARGRGRVGRAGPAGALQRLPDRGRAAG